MTLSYKKTLVNCPQHTVSPLRIVVYIKSNLSEIGGTVVYAETIPPTNTNTFENILMSYGFAYGSRQATNNQLKLSPGPNSVV